MAVALVDIKTYSSGGQNKLSTAQNDITESIIDSKMKEAEYFKITLQNMANTYSNVFKNGDQIEIFYGYEGAPVKELHGQIFNITKGQDEDLQTVTIEGYGWKYRLVGPKITRVWINEEASRVIKDVIEGFVSEVSRDFLLDTGVKITGELAKYSESALNLTTEAADYASSFLEIGADRQAIIIPVDHNPDVLDDFNFTTGASDGKVWTLTTTSGGTVQITGGELIVNNPSQSLAYATHTTPVTTRAITRVKFKVDSTTSTGGGFMNFQPTVGSAYLTLRKPSTGVLDIRWFKGDVEVVAFTFSDDSKYHILTHQRDGTLTSASTIIYFDGLALYSDTSTTTYPWGGNTRIGDDFGNRGANHSLRYDQFGFYGSEILSITSDEEIEDKQLSRDFQTIANKITVKGGIERISDAFGLADIRSDTWTVTSGTWDILSGELRGNHGSTKTGFIKADMFHTFIKASGKMRTSSGQEIDQRWRFLDSSNYYEMAWKTTGGSELRRVKGGTLTVLQSGLATISSGTTHSWEIEHSGTVIKVCLDKLPVTEFDDSGVNRIDFGNSFVLGNTGTAFFDDFLGETNRVVSAGAQDDSLISQFGIIEPDPIRDQQIRRKIDAQRRADLELAKVRFEKSKGWILLDGRNDIDPGDTIRIYIPEQDIVDTANTGQGVLYMVLGVKQEWIDGDWDTRLEVVEKVALIEEILRNLLVSVKLALLSTIEQEDILNLLSSNVPVITSSVTLSSTTTGFFTVGDPALPAPEDIEVDFSDVSG